MKNTHKSNSKSEWDDRELGADEVYVRKVSSDREQAVEANLGLQIISIRLQKTLIDALKELAKENGIGYQPYIRQLLTQHVRDFKQSHKHPIRIANR